MLVQSVDRVVDDRDNNDEMIMMAYNKEQCQKVRLMTMLTAMSENYKNNDRDAFDDESDD